MSGGGQDTGLKQNGRTPENNQAQNRQVDSIAKKLGLSKSQRRELHDRITHQGLGYDDIFEEATDIKERHKGEKPWKRK